MRDRDRVRRSIRVAQFASAYAFPDALLQHAIEDLDKLSISVPQLQRRRDWMITELRGMGYELHVPEGAFYLLPRSPWPDDRSFAELLSEHGVLVMPGGIVGMPGYLRISLTASDEMIERALPVFADAIKTSVSDV